MLSTGIRTQPPTLCGSGATTNTLRAAIDLLLKSTKVKSRLKSMDSRLSLHFRSATRPLSAVLQGRSTGNCLSDHLSPALHSSTPLVSHMLAALPIAYFDRFPLSEKYHFNFLNLYIAILGTTLRLQTSVY